MRGALSRLFPSYRSLGDRPPAVTLDPLERRSLLAVFIEILLADGDKSVEIDTVGQVIDMEVFATITGSNADGADDGLQIAIGSFRSTDFAGGAAAGNLSATLFSLYSAAGSTTGKKQDLDGDGDDDLGSNNPASPNNYFAVRGSVDPRQIGSVEGNARVVKLADLRFTVTSLRPGERTEIQFAYRPDQNSPLWLEDNQVRQPHSDGVIEVGAPVVLQGDPQPDTEDPNALADVSDIQTAGTGSHIFTVTYSDDIAVDVSTIGSTDVRVTGPRGFSQLAELINISSQIDGFPRIGTYRIKAPGNLFEATDNGEYSLFIENDQVRDISGKSVAAGLVGGFEIDIAPVTTTFDGRLIISGTHKANRINVSSIASGATIRVIVDNRTTDVPQSGINRLVINGGDGNDEIVVALSLPATIDGGNGNDVIRGGAGGDSLLGSAGNDRIFGGNGNDALVGGDGDDQLRGDDGSDRLDGQEGADLCIGGAGVDTADYSSRSAGVRLSIDDLANDGETSERDNIRGDVENLTGGSGDDVLTGSASNNGIAGNAGNDLITGGKGNDTLKGGKGTDRLFGDAGNDLLITRDKLTDTLNGGGGSDRARLDKRDVRSRVEEVLK